MAFDMGGGTGVVPRWREIPEELGQRARGLLHMYNLALEQAVAGGFGGIAHIGIGYLEREACFRYHGIADEEAQDFVVEAFEVIASARSEGKAMGEEIRAEEEKRARKGGK